MLLVVSHFERLSGDLSGNNFEVLKVSCVGYEIFVIVNFILSTS